MLKSIFAIVLALLVMVGLASAKGGNFGLGIMIGEPTGLSAKIWLNQKSAVDFGLAWSMNGDGAAHLHGDYLMHYFKLIHVERGRLPLYYGIGARVLIYGDRGHYYYYENGNYYDRYHRKNNIFFGLRIPVGLDYIFEGNNVDIFLEIAPVLDLIPSTDLDFNGGIGVRYFF
jgi:hypothetical protein